ncbi:hypothetical protein DFP93_10184 [Aneurinibacillus soli]|uniref:Uncharacterized protein n=1 Tax=Aneurinibacillus soli TaxID=1500254 RepID=A0A0U4WH49_9BACL|nr:hypothetical protein [Aneurinibacillus soli]PYE64060.1 hypothetical protein DFP93_10184 [Aneurinibacillus soli]BAU28009.1 hypothetical protein CB4_02183 [Aneurinibacillus soli]
MGDETPNKIIPFESLKRRSLPKVYTSPHDDLVNLLLDYQQQCHELFDLCITSRVLLVEYRDRCIRLQQQVEHERALRRALESKGKRR